MTSLITDIAALKELMGIALQSPRLVSEDFEFHQRIKAAAPRMLAVLECFQEGDAEEIQWMLEFFEGPPRYAKNVEVLRRLVKAAELMEKVKG